MDIGRLPNYVNTVLCVIIFFFSIFASHRFDNFMDIPISIATVQFGITHAMESLRGYFVFSYHEMWTLLVIVV